MPTSVEELKPYIFRTVSLLDRGVLTKSEAIHRVLWQCASTMLDHPGAWPKVAESLELVPLPLLSAVASQLATKRLPDGGWQWPIIGGIAPGGELTQIKRAEPVRAAVLEKLFAWLIERLAAPS